MITDKNPETHFRNCSLKAAYERQVICLNKKVRCVVITVYLSETVTSPVWSRTTARPTPLRHTHPSCPAVPLPATVAQASCPPQPRHGSPCPRLAHHALLGRPAAHRASRARSSTTILTFTHPPPLPPPADHSALLSRPPCPPSPRLTVSTSPSYCLSRS